MKKAPGVQKNERGARKKVKKEQWAKKKIKGKEEWGAKGNWVRSKEHGLP